ncbi:MAG: class I SAM-dependent methyltransferase [Acidobacteria bacterium]|nr:class I SAM-dependent methyltransferase [Acidobacteriota bacterium]
MNFIDKDVENFANDHTEPESDLFRRLERETQATMQWPEMMVGKIEGQLLKMLVQLTGARRVLEIGTFTGYSTLMMAEGLPPDGRLVTCEVNSKAEEIARRYFAESSHGHKIELRMGPALQTIATLTEPLDMVFIDADKTNYPNYYETCLPLLRPGGLIVADNVLWSGNVLAPNDDDSRAIVAFDERVQADPRVENVCLTIRDGIMLARKRSN